MARPYIPPPSVEQMLTEFCTWMAQHAEAMVTVRIEHKDGTHHSISVDYRHQKGKVE